MPAQAGIQTPLNLLDSRLRGNDEKYAFAADIRHQ
jgi:hypothetical protein